MIRLLQPFVAGADAAASLPAQLPAPATASHCRPLVGAIRWDAWQENGQGGWLVPTLNPDGSTNADHLTALAAKLKNETKPNALPGKTSQHSQSNQEP